LRKEASASTDPPRSGAGIDNIPAGRRNRTGGNPLTPPIRPDLDRAPAVIGKIEVNVAGMFGDPNMHRPLRRIEECFPCWSCCLWFHAGNRPDASPQGRASQTKMIEVAVTVAFRPPSQVQTRKKGRRFWADRLIAI
jgi:hypothetical protein